MSEHQPPPSAPELEINLLTEQAISRYLAEHPDFFNRHAPLLNSLQIPHHSHGAVSLIERQLLQLRQTVAEYQQQQREQHTLVAAN
ncbi:MAG: DUF484 family protein, partial [Plesiomonas sp.]